MKKQILSLAIALPTVLLSALPSLAETATSAPVKVDIQIIRGHDTNKPGEGNVKPKPKPGPNPPRRDPILQIQDRIVQPSLNLPQNPNINPVAPSR